MSPWVQALIRAVRNGHSCRGLEGATIGESIMRRLFAAENLSAEGWTVREIPVADDTGTHPCAVVLAIINRVERLGITLALDGQGELMYTATGEIDEHEFATIAEAIARPAARF